jgi:hypothetical protein
MRDRRRRRKQDTPRLVETPEGVRRAAATVTHQLGRDTYIAPFEVASVLRAYGVRILSALGDHAVDALRVLGEHRDFRVRAAVADELRRHRDVSAIRMLSGLAEHDERSEVQEAAREAVEELRQIAERIAEEQRQLELESQAEDAAPAPAAEAGEDAPPSAAILTSSEDAEAAGDSEPEDDADPST